MEISQGQPCSWWTDIVCNLISSLTTSHCLSTFLIMNSDQIIIQIMHQQGVTDHSERDLMIPFRQNVYPKPSNLTLCLHSPVLVTTCEQRLNLLGSRQLHKLCPTNTLSLSKSRLSDKQDFSYLWICVFKLSRWSGTEHNLLFLL